VIYKYQFELLRNLSVDFFKYTNPPVIADMVDNRQIDSSMVLNKWLGKPPASRIEIVTLEQRIQQQLPPNYAEFLSISNGFGFVSSFLDNLYPIEKVDWAKNSEET
jgi:hypothetical protein